MTGKFITFEGIDGSGKSTQIVRLKRRLENLGNIVIVVREPGSTKLSEKIRTLLLDQGNSYLYDRAEALLFSAARSQLVHEVIIPSLESGRIVLCDRYIDSTIAYQGYGRELPLNEIITIQEFATQHIRPDLKVLLDLPVEVSLKRLKVLPKVGEELELFPTKTDRMENAGRGFYQRVRQGYLTMARAAPDNWLVIDGDQPKEKIAGGIASRVEKEIIYKDS